MRAIASSPAKTNCSACIAAPQERIRYLMNDTLVRQARRALRRMAYPLARILLRYGISFEEFELIAKKAFVEVAATEFSLSNRPSSKSRIALLTGLNRREVARMLEQTGESETADDGHFNRSARIVASWVRLPAYQDAQGRPAVLPLEGPDASFESLVRSHGTEIPMMTVLRELRNSGAVIETEDGKLQLSSAGYIPSASEIDKLELLGTDVAALLSTIDNNLQHPAHARFQRKVSFPRLSPTGVRLLEEKVHAQGQQLLLELDSLLAAHDQAEDAPGHFAGLGMYVFVEPPAEGQKQ